MEGYDIVVVGAGVAGLTAAATAARMGARTLVVDAMGAGGQVVTVDRIANFPGFVEPVSGVELGPMLQEQAEAAGAEMRLGTVTGIAESAGGLVVSCDGGDIRCRLAIVAAGSTRRKLGVPGEEALEGRGVSHCASCDGPLFRGRSVVVLGGGDSAFDEATVLAEHAQSVVLAWRGAEPKAQAQTVGAVAALANVARRPRTVAEAVEGDSVVTAVRLRDLQTDAVETLPADGVFVYVGLSPNTGFLGDLVALDAEGRIETGADLRTSHPRIYAAGDIRAGAAGLLATAAGDGAAAAVAAIRALAERD